VAPGKMKAIQAALEGRHTIRCIVIHSHEYAYANVNNSEDGLATAPPEYGAREAFV